MKFHRSDPYDMDWEHNARERAEWFKRQRNCTKSFLTRQKRQFNALKARKPKPVTLAKKA
jgi:hypothetical protein